MQGYLSPDVHMDGPEAETESGSMAMESVGAGTAGFIRPSARSPDNKAPRE